MRMVSASTKKMHIIASRTTGTAEKNILQQENGILDIHSSAIYFGNGNKENKLPHINFEDKIIYILGYDSVEKWKNVLGGQYGCVYVDEINTANIEFLREIITRCDYLLGTLNPDNPDLPVYNEFINRARPYKKYENDIPNEIMQDLLKVPATPKWRYWFFTFNDNLSLTKEMIEKKIASAPVGTKLYKNKILGLRGRATGLVFNLQKENVITEQEAKKYKFVQFSIGCDTSYSTKSHDRLTFEFIGITADNKCILLEEETRNNADKMMQFAPSDTIPLLVEFAEKCKIKWGFSKNIFIDSADSGTLQEARKYKSKTACIYDFVPSWKKLKNVSRVQLQQSWLKTKEFLIVDTCKDYIGECNTYSFTEDGQLEDGNDHSIQGCQYGWLPYRVKIGNWQAIKELIKDLED